MSYLLQGLWLFEVYFRELLHYIYFDFECDITTPEHQVNYCVAQYHDKPESFCFTSLDEFCEWAFDAEKHKGYTFIAHNGRGYDFQLVMKWVYE